VTSFIYDILVTLVQSYVATKFAASTAFQLWENRRHGTDRRTDRQTDRQTDGVQRFMRPPT